MPYEIRKFSQGFKVCKLNSNECFSNKPITKKQARKQKIAIILSELKIKKK
jgi:hypothetical protein